MATTQQKHPPGHFEKTPWRLSLSFSSCRLVPLGEATVRPLRSSPMRSSVAQEPPGFKTQWVYRNPPGKEVHISHLGKGGVSWKGYIYTYIIYINIVCKSQPERCSFLYFKINKIRIQTTYEFSEASLFSLPFRISGLHLEKNWKAFAPESGNQTT